jgi:hypothetical protein
MATLARNTFTAGSAIVAADMNSNFTNVEALINDVLDGTQSHGAFQATGAVTISGAMTVQDLTVNGTLNASVSGSVDSLKGEILADNNDIVLVNGTTGSASTYRGTILASDNVTTVLANGTNGTDATFKGDVLNSAGSVIVDVSAATFNGNATTATTATTVTGSVANADQWTTSRTLSLTGDVSGSVSVRGNANMSMFTTVSGVSSVSTGSTSSSTAYLALLNSAGGDQGIKYDTTIYYNASTNQLFAPSFRATGGTSSVPSLAIEDVDTGFYSSGGGTMGATCNSTVVTEWSSSAFKPFGNGSKFLGVNGAAWNTVYATNQTINTSDDRLKVMIDDSLGLDFVKDLNPYSGVWAEPGFDTAQYEWISAQNIRAALDAHGRPYDVGMWKVQTEDPETGEPVVDGMQSVSYDGLVPVLVKAIKELAVRVEALEAA